MQEKIFSFQVTPQESAQTLLSFLRSKLKDRFSVKAMKAAVDHKKCKINGNVEFFSTHPVRAGQVIEITFKEKQPLFALEILLEDDDLIIFNKPPQVASESLQEYVLVHRLDKDTSGAILFAKREEIALALRDLFAKRLVKKCYQILCDGQITKNKWQVDNFLGKKASYQGGVLYGVVPKKDGKRAITSFECIQTRQAASLVLAYPQTGRTHQLRVQLKDLGHPVLGDWQYGKNFSCTVPCQRQMLHAWKLSFAHPITQQIVEVEAPLFADFLQTRHQLFENVEL